MAYRSSKAAVNSVMKSLSVDLAPRGITCVVLNPGWVRTDMGGRGAAVSPEKSVWCAFVCCCFVGGFVLLLEVVLSGPVRRRVSCPRLRFAYLLTYYYLLTY